jgi:hypothetical protein
MAIHPNPTERDAEEQVVPEPVLPELDRIALAWVDAQRAVIVRWPDEAELLRSGLADDAPLIEEIVSAVPRRHEAGGTHRPSASTTAPVTGRHGPAGSTEGRHDELLRRFLAELAARLGALELVELMGPGGVHEQLAELLMRLASRHGTPLTIVSHHVGRRLTDRQLRARLRHLSGIAPEPLPHGAYRWTRDLPLTPSGRLLPPSAAGRRKATPRRLSEQREIGLELEALLDETG